MNFNVLVVDDSAVMRGMIVKTLRLSGLPLGEIHHAANGAEGLERLGEHWIDIALLDVNMPVMSGEEMLEQVRSNPETRDLAVVVVSTERSTSRIERLCQLGAAFVQKPFTPEMLRETVFRVAGVSDDSLAGSAAVSGGDLDF